VDGEVAGVLTGALGGGRGQKWKGQLGKMNIRGR
jgi:hypothetical protein